MKAIFTIYVESDINPQYRAGYFEGGERRLRRLGTPRVLVLERFPGIDENIPRVLYERYGINPHARYSPQEFEDHRIHYDLDMVLLAALERGISGTIYDEVSEKGADVAIRQGDIIVWQLKNMTNLNWKELERRGQIDYWRLVRRVNSRLLIKRKTKQASL